MVELTLDQPRRVGGLSPRGWSHGRGLGLWAPGGCCWVTSVTYPLPHGALGAGLP